MTCVKGDKFFKYTYVHGVVIQPLGHPAQLKPFSNCWLTLVSRRGGTYINEMKSLNFIKKIAKSYITMLVSISVKSGK